MKIIAMGFVAHPARAHACSAHTRRGAQLDLPRSKRAAAARRAQGSYLREPFNVLDFVVVLLSWLAYVPGVSNLTSVRRASVAAPPPPAHRPKRA